MDFMQERITTIHDFRIEERSLCLALEDIAMERPMTLLIPMLFEEIFGDHIENILKHINESNFLTKVVIALAADDEQQYKQVKQFFSKLEIPYIIVWCDGPSVQQVIEELKEKDLDITMFSGKGKDSWIALGVATLDSYAIAMHDADIVFYSRLLPAKLLYSIVEPDLDFYYNKGYYARIDMERLVMYGRVNRLLLNPLLHSLLKKTHYSSNFLKYMCAFKYPLSGEFGITSDLALNIRMPGDWGLEVGLLAEVFKNTALKRICQVDLGFYEHKHRPINSDDEEGIQKMAKDIIKTILRNVKLWDTHSARPVSANPLAIANPPPIKSATPHGTFSVSSHERSEASSLAGIINSSSAPVIAILASVTWGIYLPHNSPRVIHKTATRVNTISTCFSSLVILPCLAISAFMTSPLPGISFFWIW